MLEISKKEHRRHEEERQLIGPEGSQYGFSPEEVYAILQIDKYTHMRGQCGSAVPDIRYNVFNYPRLLIL